MFKGALAGLVGVTAMSPRNLALAVKWSLEELAPDVLHKGLYVVATSAAYDRLS